MQPAERALGDRWTPRVPSGAHIYPLFAAAYPVLFLWAANVDEGVHVGDVMPVLGAVLLITLAIMVSLRFLLRDPDRAAFATMIVTIPFLTFGRLIEVVDPLTDGPATPAIFFATIVLVACGLVVAARATWIARVTPFASVVFIGLVAANVVSLAVGRSDAPRADDSARPSPVELHASASDPRPDVYYLIFDRYSEDGVLRAQFGYDNRPFLEALQSQGFVVLDRPFANYQRTLHSVASSLNMMYLDDLADRLPAGEEDLRPLNDLVEGPLVASTFQRLGYRYINVGSWVNMTANDPTADQNIPFGPTDEFSYVFTGTTLLPQLERYLGLAPGDAFERDVWAYTQHQFDAVRQVAVDPNPTFTFAHFLVPHPPYVFRADGRYAGDLPPIQLDDAYIEQIKYTNDRMLELVRDLTRSSPSPPIIVIQSDEGQWTLRLQEEGPRYQYADASQAEIERKQLILSALYLPGLDGTVPPDMSPVNTFRLILSRYFGAELELLPDRAYVYRDEHHPYEFIDVTDRLRAPTSTTPSPS